MSNNLEMIEYKIDTFKNISYDPSNKVNLVKSETEAIDFDNFVQNLDINTYKSVDALYEFKNKLHLIEFKNTKIIDVNREAKIVEKYKDTITILLNKDQTKRNLKLILVISSEKNKNYLKRERQTIYSYKKKLYYYVNLISKYKHENIITIPFQIMTERSFDAQFKKR